MDSNKVSVNLEKTVKISRKYTDTETSDEFIDSLEDVIKRMRISSDKIIGYDLSISFGRTNDKSYKNPIQLITEFNDHPELILSELELGEVLRCYSEDGYGYKMDTLTFRKFIESLLVIITNINYKGNLPNLNINRMDFNLIIEFINTEIEWMGILYYISVDKSDILGHPPVYVIKRKEV